MPKILTLILISIFAVALMGCSNDDDNGIPHDGSIVGTWKLVETYSNPGADPGEWNSVDDGYIYTFSADGTFTSTRFTECEYGTYTIESDLLTLDFGCDGFTAGIEDPGATFVEHMTFEGNKLILKPAYLVCIEGCGYKFKKIK